MNISEVFIRRPIATSLLMAALALVGIVAFPLLPVAPLPQVDFPTIQVSATVPGASPETMAATVATPLERQFGQIAGVAQMSSVSSLGSTVVTLQFDLNRNIDGAAQDVQAAITAAGSSLPKNLSTPPTYRKVNPADSPILIVSANSDTVPLPKVDDFAENVVAQQISQIPGVAQVAIGGQQKPAIRVQVDPAKLQARQLTLEDVRTRAGQCHDRRGQGHAARQAAELHHRRQRSIDRGGRLQRRHHRLPQRRAGSCARRRPGHRRTAGRDARRAASRSHRRGAFGVQATGRQRDRHRRQHQECR